MIPGRGVRQTPAQRRAVQPAVMHPDPCPDCPHKWHGFACRVSNTNLCPCPTSFKDQSQPAGVNGGWTPSKAGHDGAEPSA